jgi:hypothetical protein
MATTRQAEGTGRRGLIAHRRLALDNDVRVASVGILTQLACMRPVGRLGGGCDAPKSRGQSETQLAVGTSRDDEFGSREANPPNRGAPNEGAGCRPCGPATIHPPPIRSRRHWRLRGPSS